MGKNSRFCDIKSGKYFKSKNWNLRFSSCFYSFFPRNSCYCWSSTCFNLISIALIYLLLTNFHSTISFVFISCRLAWLVFTRCYYCHYLSRIDTDHYFCQFIMHGINVEKIIISPHVFKFQVGSHFSFSNELLYALYLLLQGWLQTVY